MARPIYLSHSRPHITDFYTSINKLSAYFIYTVKVMLSKYEYFIQDMKIQLISFLVTTKKPVRHCSAYVENFVY